jgi:hypothetical protein
MSELVLLIAKCGVPTVLGAAVIYVLLRSEIQFRYPRKARRANRAGRAPRI